MARKSKIKLMERFLPSYLKLSKKELRERAEKAWSLLESCRVCPRRCGVNRAKDEKSGFCRVGKNPIFSSYFAHIGEERPLVGSRGSGTIFFTSCNLACVYCQNYEISQSLRIDPERSRTGQLRQGREISCQELAEIMIHLQKTGCHNINLVSPTPYVPQLLKALGLAIKKGLKIPLVYNTGGYDSVESLKLLEGIIDIYMPDIKYSDSKIAQKYSLVPDYWENIQKAVKEMYRQVGDLVIDEDGIARRGLLIRHLVLPNDLAGTKKVMQFIAKEISKNSYINIMDQYRPCWRADRYPKLNRPITKEEFDQAVEMARSVGLWRFD